MLISEENGWVMLGLQTPGGEFTEETGSEFAGTCLSDPSQCEEGITLALWLRLGNAWACGVHSCYPCYASRLPVVVVCVTMSWSPCNCRLLLLI